MPRPGSRAFTLETSLYRCVLLLSDEKISQVELALPWLAGAGIRDGKVKWMDLQHGKGEGS